MQDPLERRAAYFSEAPRRLLPLAVKIDDGREANGIHTQLSGRRSERPETWDLLPAMAERHGARVVRADIVRIEHRCFHALVTTLDGDHEETFDAHLSDGDAVRRQLDRLRP